MVSVPLNAMCSNMCAMPVSPLGIVHRSGIHVGVERYDRRFVALEDDEVQAVGERKFGDALFEILKGLRGERAAGNRERKP